MGYLDIDNCIIKCDVERIKAELPLKKIKTKHVLSKIIHKRGLLKDLSQVAIYTKLYRYERDGFKSVPHEVIEVLLLIFNKGFDIPIITMDDLVK